MLAVDNVNIMLPVLMLRILRKGARSMVSLRCILRFAAKLVLIFSFGFNVTGWQENVAPKYPFMDPSLSWDVRVDDLISRLTLEEIVSQTIADLVVPGIPRLDILPYVWISECLHGQVNTNTTAFPQSIGLSAAFSPELIYSIAEAISFEARAHWNENRKLGRYEAFIGLSCFSPVINIMRHPLWGRNQETYGEDPYLAGTLVQGFVTGLQGSHPRYVRANAGCKHFDVHGGPENIPVSRYDFDAKVSMRDWRMTFLPAFKMCVDAGTYSLMCSYNSINGIPACVNEQLLTNIARKEWGFKGYIVSDDEAIDMIISHHHYLKDNITTSAACIKAGCNLELGSEVFRSQLDAMKAGLLTEAQIRVNVLPLMLTRLRLGEFDPEDMNPYNLINMTVVQCAAHRALALRSALKSFVLLKNSDQLLPLQKKFKKVAVIGPLAVDKNQIFGDYASQMVPEYTTSVAEGLAALSDDPVAVGPGCNNTLCIAYNSSEIKSAISASNIVIVTLGTGAAVEHEHEDRSDIDLPGHQLQLLMDAVTYANGVPVIVLLFNGGPLDITFAKLDARVTAIMECFFPGQTTGDAVYMALIASSGSDSIPAGRLPATWPSYLGQVPSITDYGMTGHTYRYYEGDPLYPFGYGLSYTSFIYKSFTLSSSTVQVGNSVTATVEVLNAGKLDAEEVVQVYLEWTNATILVPKIQLVAFQRVLIKSGQVWVLNLTIAAERMAVWSDTVGWTYIKGLTTLYAGGQQPNQRTMVNSNVLKTSFNLV